MIQGPIIIVDFPVVNGHQTVDVHLRTLPLSICSSLQLIFSLGIISCLIDIFLAVGGPCLSSIGQPNQKPASQLH